MNNDKMREDFEAWLDPFWSREVYENEDDLEVNGQYVEDWVQGAWIGYQAALRQAVPEGFAVVPIEPDVPMLVAGNHCQPGDYSAAAVYRAMLSAAPDRSNELITGQLTEDRILEIASDAKLINIIGDYGTYEAKLIEFARAIEGECK